MKAISQIIRVLREDESVVQLISHQVEDGRQHACPRFSYYFLMPKTRIRRTREANHPRTLCAFGPFRSADQARFISVSAHALGLVEAPTSQSVSGAHQATLSVTSARADNDVRNHPERLHLRPLARPVVQLVRRPGDTSHAA